MMRALIAYSSRKGATEAIARCIAEGLEAEGIEVQLTPASSIRSDADLLGFDAYVFGSATYHGEMMQPSKQLLFLADKVRIKGRVGGSFGAFEWTGEAPTRIWETMKHILGMDMVDVPLRIRSATNEADCEKARDYGRQVAAKLANRESSA